MPDGIRWNHRRIRWILLLLRAVQDERSLTTMQYETQYRGLRGWPVAMCVIGGLLALAACGRRTADRPAQGSAQTETARISDVRTSHTDSRLFFQYRTQSSAADCKAQAVEMPKVWNQLMAPYARNSIVQSVTLMPEDPSGVSVSFEFKKSTSGQWSAAAPCSISIPTS